MSTCADLRRFLVERFSLSELAELLADLGVPPDVIPGAELGIEARAREAVAWFDRRARLPELVAAVQQARAGATLPAGLRCRNIRRVRGGRMTASAGPAGAGDQAKIDRLTDRVAELSTAVALMSQRLLSVEARLSELTAPAGRGDGRPAGWLPYVTIFFGGLLALTLAALVSLLARGGV